MLKCWSFFNLFQPILTNTLAYCKHFQITSVKSFTKLVLMANVIKLFAAVSYVFTQ